MTTPAAPSEIRLTKLATRLLHMLVKPVGDFTSQKSLEVRLADPDTGLAPDQLPEAVFSLYDHKPQLLFESQDLKRHYALTDAGRRLQRELAPAKTAQTAQDDEEGQEASEAAPRPRTPQKTSTAKHGQAKKQAVRDGLRLGEPKRNGRPTNHKPAKTPATLNSAPTAQTGSNDNAGRELHG